MHSGFHIHFVRWEETKSCLKDEETEAHLKMRKRSNLPEAMWSAAAG